MKIISLQEAKLQGLTHYFTGKPCVFGHVVKRQVSNRACTVCASNRAILWAKNNSKRSKEIIDLWNQNNREKEAQRAQKWRKDNPDTYKKSIRTWRNKNAVAYRAYMAKATADRNAAEKRRTPQWLNKEQDWLIQQAYELAQLRTKMFNFSWHVDHVVPLRGKDVSGLHVPWNLQVIAAAENTKKGNYFEVEG